MLQATATIYNLNANRNETVPHYVSAGKRLIAKALANHPIIVSMIKNGTLVIVAGTTNDYIAEGKLYLFTYLGAFNILGFRVVIKRTIKRVSLIFLQTKIKRCII